MLQIRTQVVTDIVECNNPAECVVEYKTSNDGMYNIHEDGFPLLVNNYYQAGFHLVTKIWGGSAINE